jgi:hypothetical protein
LERIHYPPDDVVGPVARDLLQHLICPVEQRYDVEECIQHPFFASIDWAAMLQMTLPAPFVPELEINAAGYENLESAHMGPKKKVAPLSSEQQARFTGWEWSRDGPVTLPAELGKQSLLRNVPELHAQQTDFLKDHPEVKIVPKPFQLVPEGDAVPRKSPQHVERRHFQRTSATSAAASTSS